MPQCVFKSCKNNARKSNLTGGVSYFRFPNDPFTCAEWISIVARERKDEFYKPARNSVICSDHFDKSDISGNTNRRRLAKTAVPKFKIKESEAERPKIEITIEPNTFNYTICNESIKETSTATYLEKSNIEVPKTIVKRKIEKDKITDEPETINTKRESSLKESKLPKLSAIQSEDTQSIKIIRNPNLSSDTYLKKEIGKLKLKQAQYRKKVKDFSTKETQTAFDDEQDQFTKFSKFIACYLKQLPLFRAYKLQNAIELIIAEDQIDNAADTIKQEVVEEEDAVEQSIDFDEMSTKIEPTMENTTLVGVSSEMLLVTIKEESPDE